MTTIFLTGASGYVGGQVLHELSRNYADFKVAVLVRDTKQAEKISSIYPAVRTVHGSLDDADVVSEEASKADVVINAAANKHIPGAKAIHQGLARRNASSYWIQVSGASALAIADISSPSYDVGLSSDKVYDDLDGIDDIRSLIQAHPAREMDNYVLGVSKTDPLIKTALILSPIIYGKAEGPINQRSIQIPSLCKVTLERGHVVRAGAGLNKWGTIHVADVSRVFTGLAAEAAKGNDDAKLWNENGLYLTSAAEVAFGDLSDMVSREARKQGLIESSEVEQLNKDDSNSTLPGGSVMFGSNARGTSRRATALFGWKPVEHGLDEEIPRAVAEEASRRG